MSREYRARLEVAAALAESVATTRSQMRFIVELAAAIPHIGDDKHVARLIASPAFDGADRDGVVEWLNTAPPAWLKAITGEADRQVAVFAATEERLDEVFAELEEVESDDPDEDERQVLGALAKWGDGTRDFARALKGHPRYEKARARVRANQKKAQTHG